MSSLSTLKFFVTPSHDCSYLEGKKARTLFVDPKADITEDKYSELSDLGFRRSGNFIYRPHCDECNQCIPVRVAVNNFTPSKRQKRIWNKNQELDINVLAPEFRQEHYELYQYYINTRHKDGDMHPTSEEQYKTFVLKDWGRTLFIEFRRHNRLMAVAVTDRLDNGLSSIYTFFDPDEPQLSLGVYGVLTQIEYAKSMDLPYLYLGYWIKECQKMSYKTEYKPIEALIDNEWQKMP